MQFNKPTSSNIVDDVSPDAVERRMAELRAGFDHLPLGDVILHMTGEDLQLYQDQLAQIDRRLLRTAEDHIGSPRRRLLTRGHRLATGRSDDDVGDAVAIHIRR